MPRIFGPDSCEPQWLQKCELTFLRSGVLNLSTVPYPDLSIIKTRTSLKELNLSKTKLTSLEGLGYQPNLSVFKAINSSIESYKNFSSISHASTMYFRNSPITKDPNYIVAILLFAEDEHVIIEGKLVSQMWHRKAAAYPSFFRDLLDNGCPFEYPCPSEQKLRELCREYNVTYIEDDEYYELKSPEGNISSNMGSDRNDKGAFTPDSSFSPESNKRSPISDKRSPNGSPMSQVSFQLSTNSKEIDDRESIRATYLDTINDLMEKHNGVIKNAIRNFDLLDESIILENDFADELKYILEHKRRLVFDESQDMNFQLVSAVRALCMRNKYQKEEKSESEKAKSNNATPNSSEQPFVDTSSDDLDLHFEDENLDDEEGLTGYQITF